MKAETKALREQEKLNRESRERLLENQDFHNFLKYLVSNAGKVKAGGACFWLPGWIVTGCELYFTDTDGRVREIVNLRKAPLHKLP